MLWLAQGFSRTDKALLTADKLFHKELFQQADRGEGGTVCFQDEVMTTHPYFKDEISGLCQDSNTVEPATYAKLNYDLTANRSQPTDALAAHIIPLGWGGVCLNSQVLPGNFCLSMQHWFSSNEYLYFNSHPSAGESSTG